MVSERYSYSGQHLTIRIIMTSCPSIRQTKGGEKLKIPITKRVELILLNKESGSKKRSQGAKRPGGPGDMFHRDTQQGLGLLVRRHCRHAPRLRSSPGIAARKYPPWRSAGKRKSGHDHSAGQSASKPLPHDHGRRPASAGHCPVRRSGAAVIKSSSITKLIQNQTPFFILSLL